MSDVKVRVRYAPSPTGFLHIGGARSALFNYLFAKKYNGEIIFRIEDTDIERNVVGGEESQYKDLRWLGIDPDESPYEPNAKYAPYRQMERLDIYRKYAQMLVDSGNAYYCYCTNEELELRKEEQLNSGIKAAKYDRKCLNLSEEQIEEIVDTVDIYPITSEKIGDISQYSFDSGKAEEYTSFIKEDALNLDNLCISKTFVIIHKNTRELVGYFTLSADTVRLTADEKIGDLREVQFMSLPAIKVGKLAINQSLSKEAQRKGYGSFALEMANSHAYEVLEAGVACRFITVDADIEYDVSTPLFYEKNGFEYNLSRKRRPSDKTISMRRDIFMS